MVTCLIIIFLSIPEEHFQWEELELDSFQLNFVFIRGPRTVSDLITTDFYGFVLSLFLMLQIRNKINNQIILYKVHIEVEVQQAVHRPCPEATSQRPLLGQLFEGLLMVARSWLDHRALIIRVTKNID